MNLTHVCPQSEIIIIITIIITTTTTTTTTGRYAVFSDWLRLLLFLLLLAEKTVEQTTKQ